MPSLDASAASTPTQDSSIATAAVRSEIATANGRFMEAFGAGDALGVALCYTPDAQLLPAHSDVITGTEAIANFWKGVIGMGITSANLETAEVESAGDTAIEIGRYRLGAADGATIDRGKYMVLWHRHDGAWKLHRDMWTTSNPPQAVS